MGLNLVCGRAFHLKLMHLFCYIQCFEVNFQKFFFFSLKKLFFQNFDWSNLFFDQSKFCFKIYVSLCLVRLIKPVFRSIEDRISSFLKQFFDCFKSSFFKNNFNFSSLFDLARQHITFFVVFFLNFCKVFLPQGRYDYSIPPFCFIFMISCIFSCI